MAAASRSARQQPPGESWQPLSARHGGTRIDETWQEGIPAWIRDAVRDWLSAQLANSGVRKRLFARLHYHGMAADQWFDSSNLLLNDNQTLDWVDGVLNLAMVERPKLLAQRDAEQLENLLREGHSIWRVSGAHDGLERRQDKTVTSAAHRATESARSAGRPAASTHLEAAWAAIYGIHPDPSKAYGEAILAVEAVAIPEIVPRQAGATLGHVLGQLTRQGDLYELAMADKTGAHSSVEPVTSLVRLLWEGHTDRHEGNASSAKITPEAAEIAVHTAAALVQWFTTGAIRRKP